MNNYIYRRKQSDKYLSEQIKICSKIFQCQPSDFRLPTIQEDFNGVDLWIKNKGIALRIRNRKLEDLTLRLVKNNNNENELTKLKGGNMDYILQCQTDTKNENKISDWFLFDGQRLKAVARDNFQNIKTTEIEGDTSHFLAINIDDLFDKAQDSIVAKGFTREIEVENEHGVIEKRYERIYDWFKPKESVAYDKL